MRNKKLECTDYPRGRGGWVGRLRQIFPSLNLMCRRKKKCNVEKHFDLKPEAVLRSVDQILTLRYTRLLGSPIGCVTFNCQKTCICIYRNVKTRVQFCEQ